MHTGQVSSYFVYIPWGGLNIQFLQHADRELIYHPLHCLIKHLKFFLYIHMFMFQGQNLIFISPILM